MALIKVNFIPESLMKTVPIQVILPIDKLKLPGMPEKEEHAEIPHIYLTCGTEDFLLDINRKMRDYMKAAGLDVTYKEAPGSHEWDFWNQGIKKFIDWLPLDENTTAGINSGNIGV